MDFIFDLWSLGVILFAAFLIGWAAETAQTFIPRALALSILAWLQTLPEFAVEAAVAWGQQRDLMIANLTGSLRLLVGFGWPMIFFVHWLFQGVRKSKKIREIHLDGEDSLGVIFLFLSVAYFIFILIKGNLSCWDSVFLTAIYVAYLILGVKMSRPTENDHEEDLPWIGTHILKLPNLWRNLAVITMFIAGGVALYLCVHPFLHTLEKWSLAVGISTFVFIQWVAPFLSEFPEKVSAFNWAAQENKAGLGVMNMVNSNINQWTMLAAMIPIVFNISLGFFEPIYFDKMHSTELALTIMQSLLGGILILDLKFSWLDAVVLFFLWFVQFLYSSWREEVLIAYVIWIAWELFEILRYYITEGRKPRTITAFSILWAEFRRKKTSEISG